MRLGALGMWRRVLLDLTGLSAQVLFVLYKTSCRTDSSHTGALSLKLNTRYSLGSLDLLMDKEPAQPPPRREDFSILRYSLFSPEEDDDDDDDAPLFSSEPLSPNREAPALTMSVVWRFGMKRSPPPPPPWPLSLALFSKRARLVGVLLAFRADFLRSQRATPEDCLTAEVARPARASNSARSAAEVGLLKEDIVVDVLLRLLLLLFCGFVVDLF
mmetsp:Transcript_66762/g.114708  ORF Transcript_66762/g.114708 Transcript_66762/m.114708 type:complete len:215 (-) Transcript_66762:110-754(-)